MIFNVVTYENSNRIPHIEELLQDKEISYKLHKGSLSPFGWDAHKNTCMQIIEDNYNEPFLIIVEDDLELTEDFSKKKIIELVGDKKSNIICTGIFCEEGVTVEDNIVYVEKFRGTQMIIVFKEIYDLILKQKNTNKFFETILSNINLKKQITVPFLSLQSDKFISRISQHNFIKQDILKTEKRIKDEL